jgi:hypothetical protein
VREKMVGFVKTTANGNQVNTCRNCGHTGTDVDYETAIMSRYYYEPAGYYCIDGEACKARANAKYTAAMANGRLCYA